MKILNNLAQYLENAKLKTLSIYLFGQGFNLLIPILVAPYLLSKCGADNYGKIGVGLAIAFFLIVFIDYGTDILGVKYIAVNRNNNELIANYFRKIFVSKIFLAITVIVISTISYFFVPYFKENQSALVLGFTILIGQFLNPVWFFQGLERYNSITIVNVASKVIYLLLIFAFINGKEDYIYVNFFFGIGMIIPNVIGCVKIIIDYKINLFQVKYEEIRHYLKEDFTFCFSQFFLALKNYAPVVIIGFFGGFSVAGYYKIIEQIIMPIRTYLQVFFRFFYPKLSFKLHHNYNQGFSFWKKINALNFIFIWSILITIYCFSTTILHFFKVDFKMISELSTLLRFFLIYPFVFSITFATELLYFLIGKRSNYIRFTVFTVIFNLILMSLLVPKFGIIGVIISMIITEIILIVLYLISLTSKRIAVQ
ncbi:oligosaccharide flippase family protein [Flavobacterium sp. N1994]|uniref:oligosaccharide flippase family protein n=1 Tax=Flavobacterium sp. N1994 TaxID=2986827 RepID=UPI0022231914|nr:oligosaccharide flippase family protein [Flavobacterium sp. N1994]